MKKITLSVFFLGLLLLLVLPASAVQVTVYENDFSEPTSLADFESVRGNWSMDGQLHLAARKSSSGCLIYRIPAKYKNKKYRVEIDYLGHTGMGGLLIGASGARTVGKPSYFYGYTASTASSGTKSLFAYFDEKGGWGGNLRTGLGEPITGCDLHLSVTVDPVMRELTYIVTSLDGKTQYFGMTYALETVDNEKIYSEFTDLVGIRRAYVCEGSFDNFRVSVFLDDELPNFTQTATVDGIDFFATEARNALLSKEPLPADMTVSAHLTVRGRALFYFGMTDDKNGYAAEINTDGEMISLYKISNGKFSWLGERHLPIPADGCRMTVETLDQVVSLYYDCYGEGENAWPILELHCADLSAGKFGFLLEDAAVTTPKIQSAKRPYTGETYLNPVNIGADPDVLYYEGVYYLYNNQERSGDEVCNVYTSTDLAHWSEKQCVMTWDESYQSARGCMSPNVFYYDGLFYMMYTARMDAAESGSNRVFYATATSPMGPFVGNTMLIDKHALGGHPFIDEDGSVYFSLSTFDYGSNLHLVKAIVKDGNITLLEDTMKMVTYPTETYEVNGRGRTTEGGVVFKHNGYYYLFYAPGSYKLHYGENYLVSKDPMGPYEKNTYGPILVYNAALDGPGDAVIVPAPDGEGLCMIYHRHLELGTVAPRQTCVDRLKFIPNPDGGADLAIVYGPTSTPQPLQTVNIDYDVDRNGRVTLYDAMKTIAEGKDATEILKYIAK